jgi:hypothetical protein
VWPAIIALSTSLAGAQTDQYPFQNPSLPVEARINNILSLMTPEEKIGALSTSPDVPRLGIHGSSHIERLHGVAYGGPGGWDVRLLLAGLPLNWKRVPRRALLDDRTFSTLNQEVTNFLPSCRFPENLIEIVSSGNAVSVAPWPESAGQFYLFLRASSNVSRAVEMKLVQSGAVTRLHGDAE